MVQPLEITQIHVHKCEDRSATDFGKICHGFSKKSAMDLARNLPWIWGKSATDFGKICHRFWEHLPQILGKNWLGFWEKLAWFLGKTGLGFGRN